MKTRKEEVWDGLIKKMVEEAGLDSPSSNFTDKVLAEIGKVESRSPVLIYKPLISKEFWIFLAVVILSLVAYTVWGKAELQPQWLSMISWDRLTRPDFFRTFYQWSAPNSLIYGIAAIFSFVFLHVYLVRNSWDKFYKLN